MNLVPVSKAFWEEVSISLGGVHIRRADGTEELVESLALLLDKEAAGKLIWQCLCISETTLDELMSHWNHAQQWKEHLREIGEEEEDGS